MKIDTNQLTETIVGKIIHAEIEVMVKAEFENYRLEVQAAVAAAVKAKCDPQRITNMVNAGMERVEMTVLPFNGSAVQKSYKKAPLSSMDDDEEI